MLLQLKRLKSFRSQKNLPPRSALQAYVIILKFGWPITSLPLELQKLMVPLMKDSKHIPIGFF